MSKARNLSVVPNQTLGMKNRIINGAMVIDQRNAGASVTITNTGAITYTLDRWAGFGSVASKFSIQQNAGSVTPPVGFTNYLGVTSASAYTVGAAEAFYINQIVEGYNIADLNWGTANAKTITISFWVRSSLTGTFGGALRNTSFDRSYPFSYTISAANTWEQKSITIAGDTTGTWNTTNGTGINLDFGLGNGSTLSNTAGAWVAGSYSNATGATSVVGTNGATFYITGVQLEVGSSATAFDYRQYGQELALCQRYYQSYGTNTGGYGGFGAGRQTTTSQARFWIAYPPMRTVPTLAIGGTVICDVPSGTGNSVTLSNTYLTSNSGFFDVTGTLGGAAGYGCGLQFSNFTGNATLSAEL